jgi:ATP-dependent helicase HepA
MSEFAVGQRWLSETEPELGLGMIQDVDYRLIKVFFPATEEERTYARHNAPLSRLTFQPGDRIETQDGQALVVDSIDEMQGLLIYQAHAEDAPDERIPVPEVRLSHRLDLSGASDRLFAKQLDKNGWFELRHAALAARAYAERSRVQGLLGPRIDLIPHQLYIAHQVASRYAPRVLLADEVGLGKTIEAGLIIHQQLVTHRARRVLVVVPPALVHQWFVEMVRRFNLHFSIFDQARIEALREQDDELERVFSDALDDGMSLDDTDSELFDTVSTTADNPFLSAQLILVSTDFLEQCDINLLSAAEWDLLVVDEAHHLTWTTEHASEGYRRVEQLAAHAKGLLLLTATPEQLGRESHFARLRLLDPDRYSSLDAFIAEQQSYQQIATLAGRLHDETQWDDALKNEAARLLPDITIDEAQRDDILAELMDRSGPGRVLFRNTRKNIAGFPQRLVYPVPLTYPSNWDAGDDAPLDIQLHPERQFNDDRWCAQDPRVSWLTDFLRQHRNDKVLVIAAHRNTACDLHAWLGYKQGMNVAVFHEDMDLIERDRAAAWFAEQEDGAQALVCSEIGSEGRNFQFAHHLVLFDLPANPDLLEQRIGRLDRIGQQQDICLHVPYFEEHPQAVLFRWYHDGMQAFTHTNAAGTHIRARMQALLSQALSAPGDSAVVDALVAETQNVSEEIRHLMETGRDRLLELSSFDSNVADSLVQTLREEDSHTPMAFLEKMFERFGVDSEPHSEHAVILRPNEHLIEPFPGLPEDGITVTDHRSTALSRDDMQYITWEHPMVAGAIELMLGQSLGKACVSLLKNKRIKPGTLLVEALYTLECVAPAHLQAQRFLPMTLIRTLLDTNGKNLSEVVNHDALNKQCHKIDRGLAGKIVASQKELLEKLLRADHALAEQQANAQIKQALETMHTHQQHEINRLVQLKRKNPMIREEEITFLQQQTAQLEQHLAESRVQLEAVRVIVVGE